MNPVIRRYVKDDLEDLLEIVKKNTPQYFAPSEMEDLVQYLSLNIEDYFIMELDGQLIGAGGINYELKNNIAKISWDFFDPTIQNKGYGSRLLQYRISLIRSNPAIDKILVRTSQFADGFYAKNGFKEISRHKDFWADGYDMVLMEFED